MPMCTSASAVVFLLMSSCNFALSKMDACPGVSPSAEARSFPRPGQHGIPSVTCCVSCMQAPWATVGPDFSNVLVELNLCDWKNSNVHC